MDISAGEFWEFLFAGRLKITHPGVGKDRSIVRIFYKGFDMSLDAEGRNDLLHRIGKEVIYKSHKKKIEEMAGWEDTPFTTGNYNLLPCGRGAPEFKITEIPRSVPCASCNAKSSNKQCKHSCCKKCCLEMQAQGQETLQGSQDCYHGHHPSNRSYHQQSQ
jgi:hypothetical protein